MTERSGGASVPALPAPLFRGVLAVAVAFLLSSSFSADEASASGISAAVIASEKAVRASQPWPLPRPSRASGAYVAKVLAPSRGWVRLKGRRGKVTLAARTSWSRQSQTLLVLNSTTFKGREWVRLRLARRPSGSSAWFARDRMIIRKVPWWIEVRTSRRLVSIYRGGKRVLRFRSVVGAPSTPTPKGLGAIYEKNRQPDPSEFIGPWALSLTFTSNVLENYGGGPGRVAVHGRSGESLFDPLGSARSHGCIRVNNGRIRWMARKIPKGTPVKVKK